MKISICLFIVTMYLSAFSQCNNQVVTDPTSTPSNLALPDVIGQNNSPDSRYLNGFNWWADGFYQLTNMQYNPTQPNVDISNIQDPNCISNYAYLVEALGAEEMNPQNGWELQYSQNPGQLFIKVKVFLGHFFILIKIFIWG